MDRPPSRARSSYENYPERMKVYERRQAKTVIEAKISPRIFKNHSDNSKVIEKVEKSLEKKTVYDAVVFNLIIRAMLLALSILILCYHGSVEYNVLENGQILRGYSSRRTVMTFSLGYSILHSIISAIAAGMLIYSIILKRPRFSLPLMGLFLAELVCDSCDAIVTIWYFFKYLQLETALLYIAGLLLLILNAYAVYTSNCLHLVAEIWTWFGVLRLYEHRNFDSR